MDVTEALLESWNRQCQIVASVASKVDEGNRKAKPSPDGWPLHKQLAHIHLVRQEWLGKVSPAHASGLGRVFKDGWQTPIEDLDEIKRELTRSGEAVKEAMQELLAADTQFVGGYDHPVLFLQHMIWHEGWHVGLIFLALREAGQEPAEEWEEEHVWGKWRTE